MSFQSTSDVADLISRGSLFQTGGCDNEGAITNCRTSGSWNGKWRWCIGVCGLVHRRLVSRRLLVLLTHWNISVASLKVIRSRTHWVGIQKVIKIQSPVKTDINKSASMSHCRTVSLRCRSTFGLTVTLTLDLWPWTSFQQWSLGWWLPAPSFIKIPFTRYSGIASTGIGVDR